jgi:hypothetical protein
MKLHYYLNIILISISIENVNMIIIELIKYLIQN